VIESGGRVKANERCPKNGAAEDLPLAAADNRQDQKNNEADDAADEAAAVSERVGEFVGSDGKRNRAKCAYDNSSTRKLAWRN